MKASCLALYSATTSSEGLIIAIPSIPSTITKSPFLTEVVISPKPTTAGISNVLAMIAEWEVLPPMLVKKPTTNDLSNWAVSDGVKSWATTTVFFSVIAKSLPPFPAKLEIILLETSLTSAALSLIYASSIDSNIITKVSVTIWTAFIGFILSFSIVFSISPANPGSSNNSKCATKTWASCSPISSKVLALIASNWILESSKALLNSALAAATSVTFSSVITISSCCWINTLPIAYPFEAAIPFFIAISSLHYNNVIV